MVQEIWGERKVSLEFDVVVEKYLAGIFHGMFWNHFESLWKANAEELYRN